MPQNRFRCFIRFRLRGFPLAMLAMFTFSVHAQYNDWINPSSGNWDTAANWSSGLPHFSQLEVRIINVGSKAVVIQPSTPVNFPSSMTVQNLRVGGWPPNTNLLLMNFFGTTTPLRVQNDFIVEANGRVSMLSSGLNASNINLHGVFDQEGGELVFTNSPASTMQIEGGRFNLTNGYVFGKNMYLGGATNGFVNASGLVQVDWLGLGDKPTVPGSTGVGTYTLQSGWLIVGAVELIGNNGFGTLSQNGGTNSASIISIPNGTYVKNGGGLFAGEVDISNSSMTHASGAATITNMLHLNGHGPTKFNMLGGSLTTPRIELLSAGQFTQSNGTVNVTSELFMEENSANAISMVYYLYGGNLFSARTTVSFSHPSTRFLQSGGTHIVTNGLWLNGTSTTYEFRGGTLSSPTISLSGNMPNPPQMAVLGAPAYTVTNENISISGSGAITVQDSVQLFGRLSFSLDTSVNLAGNSAVMRFADSRTNSWDSQLAGVVPRLIVLNWNGSPNGGGTDQLIFGTNSSALTASQLAQIDFINPAGFPPGTNHARILATGEVVPDQESPPGGIVNSWITGSGNWDVPSNWSLGIRPDSTQAVMITNSGWKAVAINASTPANFPASMTVSNLTIRGAWDTYNTLLLNFAGTAVPLTVSTGLTIADNAQILNFNSALVVQSGTVTVTNAQIVQDGGFVRITNATMNLQSAAYHLTNGVLEAGVVNLGLQGFSTFNQYGGTATIQNLVYFVNWGGTYSLYGGIARFPNGLRIDSNNNAEAGFLQAGGSNCVTSLFVSASLNGGSPYYTLNNGFLGANNVSLLAGGAGPIDFTQNGGVHVITNALELRGTGRSSINFKLASYVKSNGTLQAGSIVLHEIADFIQANGTTRVSGALSLGGDFFFRRGLSLSGGTLGVSNVTYGEAGMNVIQTGGSFHVTNTLSFGGEPTPGRSLPTFTFENGTLTASNIEMVANMIIGSSGTAGRISNPGFFKLAGTVRIDDANESLGRFILATNSTFFGPVTNLTINLAGNSSRLSFANSSSESWATGAKLTVANWNGNPSGGGAEQLKFGTSQSGLTPAQLSQIQFTVGTNVYSARILNTGEVVPDQGTNPGLVNSWINPSNGNWDVPSNWSLGIRPDSTQAVMITNSGWKAVAINASTPVNFPASMTVSNLSIRGAWDTYNTLLLNFAGTAVPLTVLNGLTVADNAQILNFNSGLDVQGGTITVTNAQIVQDGGYVGVMKASMNLFNSEYHLTNGLFEAGSMLIGFERDSHFNQYGGTALITNLSFVFTPGPGTGSRGIRLYGGALNLPGGLRLEGRGGSTTSYLQEGGTNRTTDVLLMPGLNGPSPSFTLNGGLLADNNVNVWADTIITRLRQNGGTHTVSNILQLTGGTRTGTIRPAIYEFYGGTLSARSIILDSRGGDAVYFQSNGVARAEQIYADGFPFTKSDLTLAGGTLSSSNLFLTNGANLHQYGGVLVVSNTLRFDGYREPGPRIYSRYELFGGTLAASNIFVGGDWVIGDSATNRISNLGTISLSRTLQIGNAVEQLGRFILASSATINLAGSASRLSFANSSGETWAGGFTLVVSNWNGNAAGGGAEQLRFGANQSGLTSAQLSQIGFRIGSDFYSAKILSSGEVVPDQLVSPSGNLAFSRQGNNLVLTWPTGWTLQSATNVLGSYFDVPSATSPYSVNVNQFPMQFFRLRD